MNDFFDKFPDSYAETSRRILHTPSTLARRTFFYVQEAGYLKLKKSHISQRKNLDSYLLVLVLSGSGSLTYKDTVYPLKKNTCFFINCMIPYHHQSSETDPWELIWVHFNGATSGEYHSYYSSVSPPAFTPRSFPLMQEKMEALLSVNSGADLTCEINSSRLIMDLLSLLLQDVTNLREEKHPSHMKMTEVRQYLDQHYTDKFSLEELSLRFYLSKYHLSREFKNHFGITPNHYVITKRITYAKKLLRFSEYSLEEIAGICGFYDASYMNRQFRKSEGICASQFRKKWRASQPPK